MFVYFLANLIEKIVPTFNFSFSLRTSDILLPKQLEQSTAAKGFKGAIISENKYFLTTTNARYVMRTYVLHFSKKIIFHQKKII